MGALRRTMATSGYSDLKEFQRVEVVVTSSTAAETLISSTGERSAGGGRRAGRGQTGS